MAGGVALNCVANGKILRDNAFKDIWIQPASGDAGGALGGALAVWHKELNNLRKVNPNDAMKGSYLGPLYTQDSVEKELLDCGANFEIVTETHTISTVIESWKDWSYQKRRHITTAPLYKTKFKILLAVYPYAQFFFWTAIIILFVLKAPIAITTTILGLKLLTSYLINYKPMKQLNTIDLYWIHPIYEVMHLLVQGFFVLLNVVNKPKKWNR